MREVTTFLLRALGKAYVCIPLALAAIVASAGCDSKISSKLVATKIIIPPEQGREIEQDGVTVSVPPGTFSDPAEMDVEVSGRSIKISTVTATGAKVLSANVHNEVSFCAVVDPSFDRNKVYVLVEISEDQTARSERIPNSAIEFRDINGHVQACWQSKYVNASFRLTMDRSRTTALKLTDPNCIDPDLSRLANDEVFTLCDGTVVIGSLDLDNLLAENVKSGVVVGGVLGSVVPTPNRCTTDGAVGCVTTTGFPAVDKKAITAADLKAGKTIAGIAGSYVPDFPDAANVYNDTVNGIAGSLTLPVVGDVYSGIAYGIAGNGSTGTLTLASAANVRTGNGVFGRSGSSVTPSLTDCSTDGGTSCVAVPAFKAADMTNVVAANIKNAVTIAAVTGTMVAALPDCAADGATSCVAVTNFPAVDKVNNIAANASKIRNSVTIAGVAGTLADCADGGSGCVVVGPLQAAATVAGSASKILSGQTVAGIAGNVTLPAVGKVLTGIQFGISGTGQTGTLSLPVTSNVLTGSGTYGDPGAPVTPSYSPDYPAVSNVLSTDTVNSVAGTLTLPVVGDVNSGVSYGVAGTGSTGTLTLPAAGNVLTGSGAFGNPGTAITPTLTLPSAANVKSGTGTYGNPGSAITPTYSPDFPAVANVYSDTVDGASGTLALPVVGDVYSGIAYGIGGNGSTGTLTLASAANVRSGNGAFGRGGNSVTPSLTDCSTDGGTSCVAVPAFKAADMTNVVATNIKNAVTIAAVTGNMVAAPADCAADGATSCVAVTNFPAVDKVNNITANAAKIRDSVTIAGVAGTLADCADGGSGCVAVGPLQAAATVAGSADKILSGQTVAGISGNVTLPAVGKVLTGIQFGISGTGQTGTLSLPVASNVLSGSGTYGDPGAAVTPIYSPDYPAVSNVLSTDTVNSVAGTLTLPVVGDVNSGVSYGVAGTGSTGTLTLPAAGNVLTGSETYGNPGSAITPTLTLPSAANVKSGTGTYGNPGSAITPTYSPDFPAVANVYSDTVDGASGTLALPVVGDVYSGIAYGVGGNGSTGTLTLASAANVRTGNGAFGRSGNSVTPSLTDCSTDGATSCVAVPAFKAADMTNVVAANIKNAVTIAAVTGTMVAAPADCAADGATSCVAVTNFPAVDKVNNITANAAKIRDTVTIAGVVGTLADCADGGSGCVAVGPLQAAATVAGLASKILSGHAVAGISGNVTLPAVGKVLTGIQFGISGTGQTGTLSLPVASNVLTGSGTYGDPGAAVTPSYSPDYPAVGNVLSTDTVNSVAGTLTLPVVGDVYSGIAYGVGGNGFTGTLTLASAANVRTGNGTFGRSGNSVTPSLTDCSTDGATSCVAVPAFKAADMTNVVAANIKNAVTIAAVTGTMVAAPADCAADGATSCVAVTNFPAVDKVNNITTNAAKIRDSVTIAGVVGTLADCSDGGSGCVAVGPLQAAATVAGSASKILSGQTVAGISGNVTLPAVGKVLTGIQFGISGTGQTGTLSLPVASNVLTGSGTYGDPGAAVTPSYSPDYPAVGNVLSTDTVNSVAGTLTLPAVGDVNSGVSYGVAGTGSTGTLTLPAAGNVLAGSGSFGNPGSAITPTLTLPSAANVKSGSGTYGNPGSAITPTYSPDFPAVANVYSDTVDGVSGTLTLPTVGNVYTGTVYGVAGTGSTGTLTVPTAANVRTGNGNFGQGGTAVTPTLADCSADGGTGCVAVVGFKAADMTNVVAGKIKSGVTIAGVAGDYPSVTNPLAGADGTADLVFATFDAKIKAATNFEWFDSAGSRYVNSGDADIVDTNISSTANIFGTQGTVTAPTTPDAWDIRMGQTINGVTGKLKVACRNSVNTTVFDAGGEFKNATADHTTDFFTVTNHGYADNDTIRYTAQFDPAGLTETTTTYYVRNSTANTFKLSTTSGGAAINFTTNGVDIVVYKWGGGIRDIWDTVDDYNNNGAVFTAADMPATWTSDNFCGGAGTASSSAVWTDTTTDGACDSAGDECRFKDKISGLEWSEFQSASVPWGRAMTTCANLSFGGAGAWRLPTQKELMAAIEHGIYTAPNANWLTKAQMDAHYFWSSSTRSNFTTYAWIVTLNVGTSLDLAKTDTTQVLCVR